MNKTRMIKLNDFLCHGIIFDKCRVLSPAIIQANVGDTVVNSGPVSQSSNILTRARSRVARLIF